MFDFYLKWWNKEGCLILCEGFNSEEECREHMKIYVIPTFECGDKVVIEPGE